MNVIYNDIKAVVDKELTAANEKHPLFASLHEGYAVICEEADEAREECDEVEKFMALAWKQVRKDNPKLTLEHISRVKDAAIRLAEEAVQVAAMCDKAIMSEQTKKIIDDNWDGSGD